MLLNQKTNVKNQYTESFYLYMFLGYIHILPRNRQWFNTTNGLNCNEIERQGNYALQYFFI